MTIPPKDSPFIEWATQEGIAYYYTREPGLPGACLKLHLGALTAFIHEGKLVRLLAHSDGYLIDQLLFDFSRIFALCAQHNGYLEQVPCLVDR